VVGRLVQTTAARVWLAVVAAGTIGAAVWSVAFFDPGLRDGDRIQEPPLPHSTFSPVLLLDDNFDRPDGDGWGTHWVRGAQSTKGRGYAINMQDWHGALSSADLGHRAGESRMSVVAGIPHQEDVEVAFAFKFGEPEAYAGLVLRGDDEANAETGYILEIAKGRIGIRRVEDYKDRDFRQPHQFPYSHRPGNWYRIRFAVKGGLLRVKIWSGTSEPPPWNLEVRDPNPLPPGAVGFTLTCGELPVSARWYVDNVVISKL
jgi:hypothetical protein